ncbi:MAG: molybdopterin-guanine dinucleotide biosynthesis protein MobB [Lachnospiraceae bacterium]|nr:molybdopterin-guanine dinucleotide biosynthesis protein MobB [Lachnospiraceae bacterium]
MEAAINPHALSVGVLAGGKSSRMGQNKALLQMESRRFIDRICGELSGFSEVLISDAKKGNYEDLGLRVVYDEHEDIGPLEGIYQILSHAKEDYVFICAADMPFIKKELVEYMAEFISSDYDCYCLVDEDHIHPLCAIYSRKMLDTLREQIDSGNYRILQVLRKVRTKYIKLSQSCFDRRVVRNINTREEYVECLRPWVFCVSGIKDSGKTGLIIKLINEFIQDGKSVAVIKHDGHEYVADHEGTDTYRFTQAGAVSSVIFSDTQYSIHHVFGAQAARGGANAGVGTRSGTRAEVGTCGEKHVETVSRNEADAESMAQKLVRQIAERDDVDVVMLEGMKNSAYPKIEVVRGAKSRAPVCDVSTLICIATDVVSQESVSCPVLDMDDVHGIFLCVKSYFSSGYGGIL